MNPKEKALELIDLMYNTDNCGIEHFPNKKYCDCSEINLYQAKQCAIVAVNQILNNDKHSMRDLSERLHDEYWEEVLEELNKL